MNIKSCEGRAKRAEVKEGCGPMTTRSCAKTTPKLDHKDGAQAKCTVIKVTHIKVCGRIKSTKR